VNTLYLDPNQWDLALDIDGNIAVAQNPYSLAQDAASACRTFLGEVYYRTDLGVPYWQQILGHFPTLQLVKSKLVAAAETVPGVASAQVFISSVEDRQLRGQVQVTDSNGNTSSASF
jgi:hypothetical protein